MSTIIASAPRFEVAVDPLGLDDVATIELVGERRRRQDEAAVEELKAVAHWADLHRTPHVGAIWRHLDALIAQRGPFVLDSVLGLEGELRLAGEGAFTVEEFAITGLAAVLGLSEPAARSYVGEALELRDRLPRCCAQVTSGVLPAWKGREVAKGTIPLNAASAVYVDVQLAPSAHHLSFTHASWPRSTPRSSATTRRWLRSGPPSPRSGAGSGSRTGSTGSARSMRSPTSRTRLRSTRRSTTLPRRSSPLGRVYTVDEHGTIPRD